MNPVHITLGLAAWSTLVVVIGWHIGYRSGLKQRAKLARDQFVSNLELLRNKVAARDASIFHREHSLGLAEFDKECREVRPHIKHKDRFDDLCTRYRTVRFSMLEDEANARGKAEVLATIDELMSLTK